MQHAARLSPARRIVNLLVPLTFSVWFAGNARPQNSPAQAPSDSSSTPAAKTESSQSQSSANNSEEVSTRDTPPTFKVRVNLVLVRVVVRDAKGNIVGNLKKEDFQLTDNRKPQAISSFSVETGDSHKIPVVSQPADGQSQPEAEHSMAALPQRFVALVLDDTNILMADAVTIRDAATRLYSALAPSDRVGIFSTSGQITQDFTDNRELLKKALLGFVPRPTTGGGFHDCPDVSYYQADLIVNQHDTQALGAATEDAIECAFQGDRRMAAQAAAMAQGAADRTLSSGDAQVDYVYRHLEDATRRLAAMPGQRIMALVSPGFYVNRLITSSSDLVDRANRANIVINTIDARGLYTPDLGDIADPPHDAVTTAGFKSTYRIASQNIQSEILAEFADGTGGTFFQNRNDLDKGLQQAVAAPAVSYVLGFSPQNLKIDGRYHTLKVSLADKQRKYSVQARHGYFAPRTLHDPVEEAKEEIQEALFSQDEIHDLPVDLQTQFFRKDETEARLAVLTRVRLKGVPLRKVDGRNKDNLTIATAIFDQNGKFVTGGEKIVEMRLLDKTVERLAASGFVVKSSFDIKPGTYLVRLVVREAEGSQMAARNGAVSIPY